MRKFLSALLCTIILITICSPLMVGFSASATFGSADIVYNENGYGYRMIDDTGKEIPVSFDSPAGYGLNYGDGPDAAGEYILDYITLPDGSLVNLADIPSSYDARNSRYITSVKNQGTSACCWAFATCAALEADAVKNCGADVSKTDFSEAHLVWNTFSSTSSGDDISGENYISRYSSPYMNGGSWIRSVSTLSKWSGIANESDYPFNPDNVDAMGFYKDATAYDTGSGYILNDATLFSSDAEVKSWILNHGSCTCAIYYDKQFENTNKSSYYNPTYKSSDDINHMITIVGWNDNYPASSFSTVPAKNGAWLIKDSWGGSRHDGGYYWLSYCEKSVQLAAGFSVRANDKLKNNYTFNGAGFSTMVTNGSDTRAGNVFKAKTNEVISAVSFFVMQNMDSVTIEVYRELFEKRNGPTEGTLVSTETISDIRAGYHTVNLSKPATVDAGDYFSVVVYYNKSDSAPYIPIEASKTGTAAKYTVKPGQSYFYVGNKWYDTTTVVDQDEGNIYGNVYIQAFTECNHEYVVVSSTATCTEKGVATTACRYCGAEGPEQTEEALGHSFSEWSEYEREGTSNNYVSRRICARCGKTETRSYASNTGSVTLGYLLARIFSFWRRLFGL